MTQLQSRWRLSLAGWVGGFGFSLLADQVFTLALTFAALRSGSPASVAAVVAAVSVARVVMLLFGGAVADRVSHPRVSMTVTGIGRMILMVAMAVVLSVGHYSVPLLVIIALVAGCLDGIFQPSATSMPTHIATGSESGQQRVGALRTVVIRMSILIGNAVAGSVVAAGGPAGGFAVAGILFLAGVLCLPVIRLSPIARTGGDRSTASYSPKQLFVDALDGLRTVRRARGVGSVLLMVALLNIGFAGPVTAGIPVMAAQRGWGADGAGWVLAGFGAGAAAAGFTLIARPLRRGYALVMLAGTTGMAVCLIGIGLTTSYVVTLVLAIVMGVCSGSSGSVSYALITTNVPREQVGRANALFELTMEFGSPLSLAVTGAVATAGHPGLPFVAGGVLAGIGVVIAWLQRRVRQLTIQQ
ncbi:MFS transporter [Microlunatus soli]|uniref:Major Facilitator Superfamily protein n=1 Tax=Microlunatus soli TaxID=630515 RepID=A0A1H1QI47_9ACTN|nr:MFS transporter [Microlunatus soli]SDS23201.1 Major Facilitator Superfamily protein [Microlunatus soli]